MENDEKYDIICPKCLGSKHMEKTGCTEEMRGQCTSCTRFYPLPNNLKDWCIYYWRVLKQFYYIKNIILSVRYINSSTESFYQKVYFLLSEKVMLFTTVLCGLMLVGKSFANQ